MRTLIALGVIQTSLLLILAFKILNLNDNPPPNSGTERHAATVGQPETPLALGRGEDSYVDSGTLRAIIREELAAHFAVVPEAGGLNEAIDGETSMELAYRQQRDLVNQQLEYYASVGQITHQQMEELQSQIAKLDKNSRQEMLRKLVRQLNTGAIEGRL